MNLIKFVKIWIILLAKEFVIVGTSVLHLVIKSVFVRLHETCKDTDLYAFIQDKKN